MNKPRIDQGPDYERGFIDGMQYQMQSSVDKAVNRMAQPEQEPSCAECGVNGGYALYCVACAEKFVGGYKENVPVHTSELLTQVSTDIPTPPQTNAYDNMLKAIDSMRPAARVIQDKPATWWLDEFEKVVRNLKEKNT